MSHSGTSQLLSLGKFKMFLRCSQWGHPGHMIWEIVNVLTTSFRNILNEPLRNTAVTFFGKIQDVPKMFLIGTPQSHHSGHCECIGHFLCQEHCKETGSENFE